MTAVRMAGICKAYGPVPVLTGIDLTVEDGELFFLLGASGCGKTTLLRIVAGLLDADAGQVFFDNDDVTGLATERRRIGMVFQNYALWPHLDVAGNVAFGLEMQGQRRAACRDAVDEALDLVGLPGYAGRRVDQLSGGQQQRVALARALALRPRLLLLDEPLSNLDARLREEMRATIRRVCKATGVTALYVTHDQHEALTTADRIAVMADGGILQVADPRRLYLRPADRRVATFVGRANLFAATVVDAHQVDTPLGRIATQVPAAMTAGAACTVCIRPEHLRLHDDPGSAPLEIVAGSFAGHATDWTCRHGQTEVTVREPGSHERQPGTRVGWSVDQVHVVVLPS